MNRVAVGTLVLILAGAAGTAAQSLSTGVSWGALGPARYGTPPAIEAPDVGFSADPVPHETHDEQTKPIPPQLAEIENLEQPDTPDATETPIALAEPAVPDPELPSAADLLAVERRWPAFVRQTDSVIAQRQVIAYYGHPNSRFMGILGENDLDIVTSQLRARAAEYDRINGDIGVAPAFHIIFGTVYEDASVGILSRSRLLEYVEYALANDVIVFLDHQIGNGTVEGAIEIMLPYLHYENVHLAIDPEWATDKPGQVIGQVDAADINQAQQMIQDYLVANDIPGTRMLVVHQFNWRMIQNRDLVRSDFERVQVIHHADGFGNPDQKRSSWQHNVIAENMPLKGFKLFYPKSWRSGGFDVPLMSPEEVMSLEPVPVYVQYQ